MIFQVSGQVRPLRAIFQQIGINIADFLIDHGKSCAYCRFRSVLVFGKHAFGRPTMQEFQQFSLVKRQV